ncbi:hypothetical protein [Pedobacter sp. GR22-10]|uniref:hypothetical protein n=1 Tax=Pedobacter sp. GR22-10 TaxID=2994472 RepID=UPI0022466969|nr:hypothetical protein [Pedobacter sp. GR22-10]MCX2431337.1 hypothetical protein [Pedobacter sp. GR22-10]
MKSIEINMHPTFAFYKRFFELKSVSNYLYFMDEWMELMLSDYSSEQKYAPADLLFFYRLLVELYEISFATNKEVSAVKDFISKHSSVTEDLLEYETYCYFFNSRYLTAEELMQPLKTLNFLYDEDQLFKYKNFLFEWLSYSLEQGIADGFDFSIYSLYRNTKRLIEASWLIYERLLRALERPSTVIKINHFQDTCPTLLRNEYLKNPYHQIIQFFREGSLGSYRDQLKAWFKAVIANNLTMAPPDFIYLHDQLTRLLEACYLISAYQIPVSTPTSASAQPHLFSSWLALQNIIHTSPEENDPYAILTLQEDEKTSPLDVFHPILTLENIFNIREDLKEWSYCGSKAGHIAPATGSAFNLYEILIKIMELALLLVAVDEDKLYLHFHNETFINR